MAQLFSVVLLIFTSIITVCSSQLNAGFNCTAQKKCGACAAVSPQCHWCKDENFDGERCNHLAILNQTSCRNIVSPRSSITYMENEAPRNARGSISPPVLLAPQKINITLRPNEPFQFSMVFRQAENYPVDIYFLMDVSFTMKAYKDTLSRLTDQLVQGVRNITTDYRLGFGSFVDKTVLPFVLTGINNQIVDQCNSNHNCSLPYGFRNQLSLTQNEAEFKQRVADLGISGNLDAPEGGFDAIMQSIVCKKDIGWREQSRKMILFSTDGTFHYAGDGKLGGIVIPNDGNCHLTADGLYSESNNQDYPSINQLAQKISEKKVNVIFLVPEKQVELYRRLSDHILGSNVGQLKNDSSNVIELVRENYEKIRSAVELKTEAQGDLQIDYQVTCKDGSVNSIPRCEGIGIGESVNFSVSITANSCPSDRSQWIRTLDIYPVGLTEKLTLQVELICECPCELPGKEIPNSDKCNTTGTYECGICTCNKGYYGKTCECGAGNYEDGQDDMPCRLTNTSDVCQGKGQCECGQCVCGLINPSQSDRRYSGTHCQCNDYSCSYSAGQLCGGPSRGVCKCGKCQCDTDYTGEACDCQKSNKPCETKTGLICNNKGTCKCGACQCTDIFRGPTCEDCPTCPGKCDENEPCVRCHFQAEKADQEKCLNDCAAKNKTVELVDDLTGYSEETDWRKCPLPHDADLCSIIFAYNYKTNEVKAKRTKECIHRTSNLVIILSVVGTVIAIGIIALLIWKVVVTFHDKREYQAFVEEQTKARWDVAQNPVYKPATTNFQNPTYRPGSTITH